MASIGISRARRARLKPGRGEERGHGAELTLSEFDDQDAAGRESAWIHSRTAEKWHVGRPCNRGRYYCRPCHVGDEPSHDRDHGQPAGRCGSSGACNWHPRSGAAGDDWTGSTAPS